MASQKAPRFAKHHHSVENRQLWLLIFVNLKEKKFSNISISITLHKC